MLGGVDLLNGEISPLDNLWLSETVNGVIFIVDVTSRNLEKSPYFRDVMKEHFSSLTESKLVFLSEMSSQSEIVDSLKRADVIYIPGGDTDALLDNLAKHDVANLLRRSVLPIAGNSAGALALCEEVVLTTDDEVDTPRVRAGLGIVPFSIDPHYESTHDDELFILSDNRVIYGLPEQSGIIVDGGCKEFVGSVWKFTNGFKKQVH